MLNRNTSLKRNLLLKLYSLLSLVLIIISIITFFNARYEIEEVFDVSLAKYSKILLNLVEKEVLEGDGDIINFHINGEEFSHNYEYKIHSQIWRGNKLAYNSNSEILFTKPLKAGFSDISFDKDLWRSFTLYDKDSDITVEVLENYDIRRNLVHGIIFSIFFPILLSFIPLFMVIAFAINKGLRPLNRISKKISKISPYAIKNFTDDDLPLELKPIVTSLNLMLIRISDLIESERKFTDHAAHELRTPIAAIKAQAQLVYMKCEKEFNVNNAIKEEFDDLIKAIDRSSHLIDQLLFLSRLESEKENLNKIQINLKNSIHDVFGRYYRAAKIKNLSFNFHLEENRLIAANIEHIEIMLSNIIDNAIKYSVNSSVVDVYLTSARDKVIIRFVNVGSNIITKDEQEKLFDRFYRVKNSRELGCGLGLSIVNRIAKIYGAVVEFNVRDLENEVVVIFKM